MASRTRVRKHKDMILVRSRKTKRRKGHLKAFGIVRPELIVRGTNAGMSSIAKQMFYLSKGMYPEARIVQGEREKLFLNSVRVDGRTVRVMLRKGALGETLYTRPLMQSIEPGKLRGLLRKENRRVSGKPALGLELARAFPYMLRTDALLVIGDKYLVIPKRRPDKPYASFFHQFSRAAETKQKKIGGKDFGGEIIRSTRKGIKEEIGLTKEDLERLKMGKPLTVTRNIEVELPALSVVHVANYPEKNPEKWIKENFRSQGKGLYRARRKGRGDYEAMFFTIIPVNPEAIRKFIREHEERITPMLRISLEAYIQTLEKKA